MRAVSARGVKVVMCTHNLGQAKRLAGNVVLLHRGRLIETTPPPNSSQHRAPKSRKFVAGDLLIQ